MKEQKNIIICCDAKELPQEYYKKRYEELLADTAKITKKYEDQKTEIELLTNENNELRKRIYASKLESEEFFSTMQVQSEYIRELESKVKVDPDAMLTVR